MKGDHPIPPPFEVWLLDVPRQARAHLRRLNAGPRKTTSELRAAVDDYLGRLVERSQDEEFLDLATARRCADCCALLIGHLEQGAPDRAQHLVQAAVDYFVLEDDAEQDSSIVGFDDDLEVLRIALATLGLDPAEAP